MTIDEIKRFYGTSYMFHKKTGMAHSNYRNWESSGFIPMKAQVKIQRLSKGALIAEYMHARQYD